MITGGEANSDTGDNSDEHKSTEGIGSEGGPTDGDEKKALDDVKERTDEDRKYE
jgi:hypothetical protein